MIFIKHTRKFLGFLLACLILSTISMELYAVPAIDDADARKDLPIESNELPDWPEGPVISAQSAILIDADTGTILYAKNIHEKLYPASTTKILTCLIATEECDLSEIVTFSHDAVFDTPRDSSHIAMDVGYELTVDECLQAILIASANEVSFALAEHITGTSWADFAELMNERARELGCVDSNFVNPNGLPDENHYTSAHDLSMIGRAFFANELLCKYSSSPRLDLEPTEKQPKHVLENSKNQLFPGKAHAYEYLVGSKTGYTSAAKSTLVSCAEKDGMKLIAVVMVEDSPAHFADTVTLFQYGFQNFKKVNISQTETQFHIEDEDYFYTDNNIFGSSDPIFTLNAEDAIVLPNTIDFADVNSAISYEDATEGQAGIIRYSYKGIPLGEASLDFAAASLDDVSAGTSSGDAALSKNDRGVIFINVFKVILWILGIAGAIILIVFIFVFIRNYHIELNKRSSRRTWWKERKHNINRDQKRRIASAKRNIRAQRKKEREARRRRWGDDD